MRTWPWFPIVVVVPLLVAAEKAVPAPASARTESEARLRRDITFLASDECEGRGPGTRGIDKAADYIVEQFKKAGLKAGGADGSYLQPFTVNANVLDEPARFVLTGPQGQTIAFKQGVQFWPMALGGSGSDKAPAVFAGYGITSDKAKYDDFADVDVADKVVILLRGAPHIGQKSRDQELLSGAPFVKKIVNAEKHGAAAVLFVNDAGTAHDGDDLLDFNYTAFGRSASKFPVLHVRRAVLEMMLPGGADTLTRLEKDINRELKPHSLDLPGWTVDVAVRMHRGKMHVKNIVGVLEGAGPLANETVVIGAHYDHLGYGGSGSLSPSKKMAIHHGADDNASGTTTLMELARRLSAMKDRQGRRLVFIAFSGEELGLFGSEYYCKHPLYPLDDTASMFNIDMVGRLRTDKTSGKAKLLSEGCGTAKPFRELLDKLGDKYDFKMVNKPSGFGPSDHNSFCSKEVPVLFVWTDYHDDYHRPSDTADKINVEGMRRIADLSQEAILTLARMDKPEYVKVKNDSGGPTKYQGPTLGIRPSYSDEEEGLLIGDVVEGRPAASAGLKADDRIISIDGKPIKNIQTYMTVLGSHKKGDTIEVGFLRDSTKKTVKVKLE
ncbi:MAG TPA: M28 family peptidase [Gemmataceae bacterium]|nr:M28 family peptidase [Gemmataceae bacterium]